MNEKLTIADLSGHANELTAWKLLKEVSEQAMERKQFTINPSLIEIGEGSHFVLMLSGAQQSGFDAPETLNAERSEASAVWSLGATAFYAVMGVQVMNGKGGLGQTKASRLPYMRSGWPELSELIQQCLQFDPIKRTTLRSIHDKSLQHYEKCLNQIKRGPRFKLTEQLQPTEKLGQDLDFWPETMTSTMNKHTKSISL